MNIIGNTIREHRKAKGLTQEELAEKTKINLRTIQRIESSDSAPRESTLRLICNELEIERETIQQISDGNRKHKAVKAIVNGFFLVPINLIIMAIVGYLTLDSYANLNSRTGALLLSYFLPFFIVYQTRMMSGLERMLRFGTGLIVYILLSVMSINIMKLLATGFLPSTLITLSVLYFGHHLFKK